MDYGYNYKTYQLLDQGEVTFDTTSASVCKRFFSARFHKGYFKGFLPDKRYDTIANLFLNADLWIVIDKQKNIVVEQHRKINGEWVEIFHRSANTKSQPGKMDQLIAKEKELLGKNYNISFEGERINRHKLEQAIDGLWQHGIEQCGIPQKPPKLGTQTIAEIEELWWEKEQRFKKAQIENLVALRREIKKITGMG